MHLNLVLLGSNMEERGWGWGKICYLNLGLGQKRGNNGGKKQQRLAIQLVSRSNREIKGNTVQTQYKPDLLVEKGKKVGTGGQVNRVSPARDLLASHSIRWLYRTKMGPT